MQIDNIDKKIPKHTQQILTALNNAGFEAYIVGGAVRDLLLRRIPSDFDITTNAHPEQVLEVCIQKQWKTVCSGAFLANPRFLFVAPYSQQTAATTIKGLPCAGLCPGLTLSIHGSRTS